MQWLMVNGGDPIGFKSRVDPCASAGLALALLFGRKEDISLSLPAQVVMLIVNMFATYLKWGPGHALPYANGLAEYVTKPANLLTPSK